MLALVASLFMTIMSLSSTVVWLLLWKRNGTSYMLLLLGGWLLLCLHSALLAVSAGPNPAFSRGDIEVWVYALEIVLSVIMEAGKLLLLRGLMRNGKHLT